MKSINLRILFIGNSHTYFNDLPSIVARMAQEEGFNCFVTMLSHGGWFLAQHAQEPEVLFNIRYGHYDYVVLQEHSHPMAEEEKYRGAARQLCDEIHKANAKPVIYATWATKAEPEKQEEMNELNRTVAEENHALLAPVGEVWWSYMRSWPNLELYATDGQHASPAGSEFAAKIIWVTIRQDINRTARETMSK